MPQAHGAMIAYGSDGHRRAASTGTASSSRSRRTAPSRCGSRRASSSIAPGSKRRRSPRRSRACRRRRSRPLRYAKGNYFQLLGRAPFTRLIYPVPERGGLGVHLTLDLGGQAKFGPDVEWVERLDYTRRSRRAPSASTPRSAILAGLAGRGAGARLCGHSPEIAGLATEPPDFVIQGTGCMGSRA